MTNAEHLGSTNRNAMLVQGAIIMLFVGIINSVSVFVRPLAVYYGWETSAIANVSSTMLTFWPIGSIMGGKLLSKLGARTAILVGSLFFGSGLLLTGLVPASSPWMLYFTFSFLIGLGNGICYAGTTYATISWFPDRRGLAAGVCMGINGGSSAFLAPLLAYLTAATSIKVTLISAGIVCTVICIFLGFRMKQAPEGYVPAGYDPAKAVSKKKTLDTNLESYDGKRAVKTRHFWHIFLPMSIFPGLYLVMFSRFSVFMTERGIDLVWATLGVSLYNVASSLGRLGLGALIDRIGFKKVYFVCLACCLGSAILLMTAVNPAMIIMAYILLGAGFGATNSVYPVSISTTFGPMHAGALYGYLLLGYMVCTQLFPRAASAIIASTGSYVVPIIGTMVLSSIGFISMALLPKLNRKPITAAKDAAVESN